MPETWGAGENPYREDGCVEAWVVKATPKDSRYYLGYLLYWIEKRNRLELRVEQYDKHGELWKIGFETTWKLIPGGYNGGGGWSRQLLYGVDYKRDFWTLAWYFGWAFGINISESKFTQQELMKEYFWKEPAGYRTVTKFEHMPPYPLLYDGVVGVNKPSKHRAGVAQIEAVFKKKIKDHNGFWEQKGGYDAWGWAKRTKFQDVK